MPGRYWILPGLLVGAAYFDLLLRTATPSGATLPDLFRTVSVVMVGVAAIAIRAWRTGELPPQVGILGFSLLFHLIGVFASPVLEDDGYRFLFDAWVFDEFGSPYGVAPETFFSSTRVPEGFEAILSQINHPHLPTVYGPTLQWIFRLAHLVSPGEIRVLQAIMAICSFMLVCLVSKRARPIPLLFFAWHPLLIKEFAFTAHPDALGVLLLVFACSIASRSRLGLGMILAMAVGAKFFALLLVPVLLRRSVRAWLAFVAVIAALYWPFVGSMVDLGRMDEGALWAMGAEWIFNAPLYLALQSVMAPFVLRAVIGVTFVFYWVAWTRRNLESPSNGWPRGDQIFGVMLLLSPVLNPWYVLWPLAFWASHPTKGLLVASVACLLSYANGLFIGGSDLAPYEVPTGILLLEFGLIAAGLAWDWREGRQDRHREN